MPKGICSIDGCNSYASSRGWCHKHYTRWVRHGDPLYTENGHINKWVDDHINYEGDDCLIWPFGRPYYATFKLNKRTVRVSRYICKKAHGPPPTNKHEAAHSCGNGHIGCVNQKHLRWATHQENQQDKILHNTTDRGEKSPFAKFINAEVDIIRERLSLGESVITIAKEKKVSSATIYNIRNNRTYKS